MMVAVVFIHVTLTYDNGTMLFDEYQNYLYAAFTSNLFSQTLARMAVPVFFLISGYLFFYRTNFSVATYVGKLQKRSRTLLVPYLFWNSLFLLFGYTLSKIGISTNGFASYSFSPEECLAALWAREKSGCPAVYPFWFIRDLMVCVVFSPIIWLLIQKTKYALPLALGILWYFELPFIPLAGFSNTALFFFSLGASFSINQVNIVTLCNRFRGGYCIILIPFIVADVLTKGEACNLYIHHAGILLGLVCLFKAASHGINSGMVKVHPFLSSASFFIFATHVPWFLKLEIELVQKHLPTAEWCMTLHYFFKAIFIVLFALATYYILKRFAPKPMAIITGGR